MLPRDAGLRGEGDEHALVHVLDEALMLAGEQPVDGDRHGRRLRVDCVPRPVVANDHARLVLLSRRWVRASGFVDFELRVAQVVFGNEVVALDRAEDLLRHHRRAVQNASDRTDRANLARGGGRDGDGDVEAVAEVPRERRRREARGATSRAGERARLRRVCAIVRVLPAEHFVVDEDSDDIAGEDRVAAKTRGHMLVDRDVVGRLPAVADAELPAFARRDDADEELLGVGANLRHRHHLAFAFVLAALDGFFDRHFGRHLERSDADEFSLVVDVVDGPLLAAHLDELRPPALRRALLVLVRIALEVDRNVPDNEAQMTRTGEDRAKLVQVDGIGVLRIVRGARHRGDHDVALVSLEVIDVAHTRATFTALIQALLDATNLLRVLAHDADVFRAHAALFAETEHRCKHDVHFCLVDKIVRVRRRLRRHRRR
mmetsp:Transcript_53592/g.164827  ORF Transcript_53592/g.164827 Transcript_53592/m.164827 type:complete len:431 (+) Transcript_53592:899-2191(+)